MRRDVTPPCRGHGRARRRGRSRELMIETRQNPNEDTEWNDILRSKGIIPEKPKDKEITEDQIINLLENTVDQRTGHETLKLEDKTLDELDELEDEEDEKVLEEYRRKRFAEMKALVSKSKYGDVKEISAQDYVAEVNNAGEDVWVVLHLYKSGISTTCIPNWPDKNLPTIFIYHNGEMAKQIIGPIELRGMKLTEQELEWMLGEAVPSKIKEDPKPKVRDVLFSNLRINDNNDSDDW
ncbi:hypothetical protein G9C98_004451 [Cotesia typhae]|uniref:Phosducin domain-containing protein n=1 Tax=Cotesia typhae TaxID=2053667 RepID=A0A8J5V7R3_9HYME|nr:hypothetical protein G9C98_004451 [Cotesia typhae]